MHMGTRGTRVSCTGFRMLLHVCAGGTRSLHSGAREVLHVGARGTRASRVGAWKGLHICARGLRAYGMLVSGAQGRQASVLGSSSVPGSVCTSVPGHEGIVHQCQGTFAGQGSLCVGARELLHHVGARGTRVLCVSDGGLLHVTAGDTRALHVGARGMRPWCRVGGWQCQPSHRCCQAGSNPPAISTGVQRPGGNARLLRAHSDGHHHQPGPAVAGAAHPHLLGGPVTAPRGTHGTSPSCRSLRPPRTQLLYAKHGCLCHRASGTAGTSHSCPSPAQL